MRVDKYSVCIYKRNAVGYVGRITLIYSLGRLVVRMGVDETGSCSCVITGVVLSSVEPWVSCPFILMPQC